MTDNGNSVVGGRRRLRGRGPRPRPARGRRRVQPAPARRGDARHAVARPSSTRARSSLTKPVSRRRLYWTTRAVFVTGFIQVPTFDRVFREVFGSSREERLRERPRGRARAGAAEGRERERRGRGRDDEDLPTPARAAPDMKPGERRAATTTRTPTSSEIPILSASEEEELSREALLRARRRTSSPRCTGSWSASTSRRRVRRTRRRKRGRHGEHMDMRRTLRNSLKTGGDPIKLARRRRRVAEAPARPAVRHLRLDGALRARVPAVPALRPRERPRRTRRSSSRRA